MKNGFIVAAKLMQPVPTITVKRFVRKKGEGDYSESVTLPDPFAVPVVGEWKVYVSAGKYRELSVFPDRAGYQIQPGNTVSAGSFDNSLIAAAVANALNKLPRGFRQEAEITSDAKKELPL